MCKRMLINLSNHPSTNWSETQLSAAQKYGKIYDLPFPQVDAAAKQSDIHKLAEEYFIQIQKLGMPQEVVVHIMGEFTFCFTLVNMLKMAGYNCVASTTQRKVKELGNEKKEVTFDFVNFREY